jgi:hypothetical protein
MKETNERVSDKIVVNGFLTPEETVRMLFGVINRAETGYVYRAASGMKVTLTEDGNVLYDGICEDTVLSLDYQPKENKRYRIEARLDGYEPVSAETTVPEAVACVLGYRWKNSDYYNANLICRLYDFSNYGKNAQSAVYVSYYTPKGTDTLMELTSLYSMNLLIDNINRIGGMPILDEEAGSLYFENFMRVKRKNIPLIDTLVFAPEYGYDGGILRMLTASDEYDRYMRTFYEQAMNIAYDDFSGAFARLVPVYSNVSGGLGIFAGHNQTYYPIEKNETNGY